MKISNKFCWKIILRSQICFSFIFRVILHYDFSPHFSLSKTNKLDFDVLIILFDGKFMAFREFSH